MATLKSKRKQEAVIEELTTVAEQTTPSVEEVTTESPYLNEAEQNALAEQQAKSKEDSKKVSIVKMESAVEVVQGMFNLCDKNFSVNGFSDKGSKCQLSMSNGDFDIVVTIKDAEKYGIN